MKKEIKLSKEEYIKNKTEELIIEMLDSNFASTDKDEFDMKLQATRTAMVHLRDREMMKRISQAQTIRLVNVYYGKDNFEAKQEYLDATMPQLTISKDKD